MSVSEPESSIHSLFSEVEDEHLQERVRESEQLASGSLNGRFRVWRLPGRTVKKNAITGAVLGPKCFRTVLA